MSDFLITDQRLADLMSLMLPLAGVLLGLVFAAMIYWFEASISALEFTRELVTEIIAGYSRIILSLLTYIVLVSLLHLQDFPFLVTITFLSFAIVFMKAVLDFMSHIGYVETLATPKVVPEHLSPRRQYFRKIRNAGLKEWARLGAALFTIVLLPAYWFLMGRQFRLSNEALYVSVMAASVLVLLELPSMVTQALTVQRTVVEKMRRLTVEKAERVEDLTSEEKWPDAKIELQSQIATRNLQQIGISSALDGTEGDKAEGDQRRPVLKHPAVVNEYGLLHLNLLLPQLDCKPGILRALIYEWTENIMKSFKDWHTDIVDLCLSYWLPTGEHLALFRANKDEIESALSQEGRDFIKKLRVKCLTRIVSEDLR